MLLRDEQPESGAPADEAGPARDRSPALIGVPLLIVALGGVFGQLAAWSAASMPLPVFLALRLGPQAALAAAAVGLLYHGRGCLLVAAICLLLGIAGDVALILAGRAAGLQAGTLLAGALLLGLMWRWAGDRARRARGARRGAKEPHL